MPRVEDKVSNLKAKIKVQEYLVENMWSAIMNRQEMLVAAIRVLQENENELKDLIGEEKC